MALFVSSRSISLYEIRLSKASPFSFRTAHLQQASVRGGPRAATASDPGVDAVA
jgi:hypothetical protein